MAVEEPPGELLGCSNSCSFLVCVLVFIAFSKGRSRPHGARGSAPRDGFVAAIVQGARGRGPCWAGETEGEPAVSQALSDRMGLCHLG